MRIQYCLRFIFAWTSLAALGWSADPLPGWERGALQERQHEILRLVQLRWEDKGLQLDRGHWERAYQNKTPEQLQKEREAALIKRGFPAKWAARRAASIAGQAKVRMLFEELHAACGSGSSSWSGGGEDFHGTFQGKSLAASLRLKAGAIVLRLEEQVGTRRSIQIEDDGQGSFRLNVTGERLTIVVNQSASGHLAIAHIQGEKSTAYSADSFIDFHREHRRYVGKELFPLLKHLGIGIPLTPQSPEVIHLVLARLVPLSERTRQRGVELLNELDADDFSTREKATEQLDEQYELFQDLIAERLEDSSLSTEARRRLSGIVGKHKTQAEMEAFIARMNLLKAPPYLIEILPEASGEQRSHLIAQLAKLTGEDFGDDHAAWQQWLKKQPPKPAAADEELDQDR